MSIAEKTIEPRLAFLALSLILLVASARADELTPQQQYSAVFKQYSPVSSGLRKATTDRERQAAVRQLAAFAPKFVALADRYPEDPIALTALRQAVQIVCSADSAALQTWEMNRDHFAPGSRDGSASKTVAIVLRDHLRSDQLGPVIDRMRYGYRMEYERCLSTLLAKNPHRAMQGLACLAAAQMLNDRLQMVRLAEDRPELVQCYEIVFGKDYLPELIRLEQARLAQRIEALFERAARDYGDVKFRATTVGATAKSELYAIRNLSIGRTAPEIEGQDQDGERFKLSDYRGKVVLLYFWSEY